LSVDSYWNCLTDCHHCYLRRLNRTWGKDLRPADPEQVMRKLCNGLKNKNPRSSLAWALHQQKTIRVGDKSDPYQNIDVVHGVTRSILKNLAALEWTFVIQTRFTMNMHRDIDILCQAKHKDKKSVTIMPVISPGAESDWEVLEQKRTTNIVQRLKDISDWIKMGFNLGVNGEPFIPGYHTTKQFRDIIRRLKSVGVQSYNTYNLHFNDYVAKRFHSIGLDITKIWEMNQDKNWRPIQHKLCEIADEEDMILGCPDFVNTPKDYPQRSNTCCGMMVPHPSRFNSHWWKHLLQKGKSPNEVLRMTWEGIGDLEQGKKIVRGEPCDMYTMKDAGLV
jgi:DNA repair photolyase